MQPPDDSGLRGVRTAHTGTPGQCVNQTTEREHCWTDIILFCRKTKDAMHQGLIVFV